MNPSLDEFIDIGATTILLATVNFCTVKGWKSKGRGAFLSEGVPVPGTTVGLIRKDSWEKEEVGYAFAGV
jgi:hypothetical protein